jgi:hypothetical protein
MPLQQSTLNTVAVEKRNKKVFIAYSRRQNQIYFILVRPGTHWRDTSHAASTGRDKAGNPLARHVERLNLCSIIFHYVHK